MAFLFIFWGVLTLEKLEEYFAHDYLKEKEMQKLVINLINDVIPTYTAGYNDKLGFRYEIREEEDALAPKFSASTNAMLVNSLNVLLGEHDIVRVNHQIINNQIYIKDNLQETSKVIQSVVEMLLKEFTVEKKI